MAVMAITETLRNKAQCRNGQMTVELMAVLPVALIIAAIAVNAIMFFGDCAHFDRVARNAIRTYATSPAYGVQAGQSQASIQEAINNQLDSSYLTATVTRDGAGWGITRYTATLDMAPNLFGMGLRSSVFGVALPHITHSTSLVVDAYKPGVFFE